MSAMHFQPIGYFANRIVAAKMSVDIVDLLKRSMPAMATSNGIVTNRTFDFVFQTLEDRSTVQQASEGVVRRPRSHVQTLHSGDREERFGCSMQRRLKSGWQAISTETSNR